MTGTATVGGALRAAVEAVHAPTVIFSWVRCEARVLRTVVAVEPDPSTYARVARLFRQAEAAALIARLTAGDAGEPEC